MKKKKNYPRVNAYIYACDESVSSLTSHHCSCFSCLMVLSYEEISSATCFAIVLRCKLQEALPCATALSLNLKSRLSETPKYYLIVM